MNFDWSIPHNLIEHFECVYIDHASLESAVAQRIFKYFPESKIKIVNKEPFPVPGRSLSTKEFDRSKKNLFVTPFKGDFFKRCPGATQKKALTCCNYFVLNLGSQCNMNCSYCYLQSYLNSPIMKIYSNIDHAFAELREKAKTHENLPFRVGTGEIIDSLSLDEITLYSRQLISFFKDYPKWTLEFKTKSSKVDHFLDLPHSGNIVVSWSINPEYIIEKEEHGTARLEERLAAAEKCVEKGYKVAFHFDPMIYHTEWKKNYAELAGQIQKRFSPKDIHVISLGTLRFQPQQRFMMKERFGWNSLVNQAEMFPSEGGKWRYDQSLRQEMFQWMLGSFKKHSPAWNIFLCMETPETWIANYQEFPMQVSGLKEFFRPLPNL